MKLTNIIPPDGDIENLELSELINVADIQVMMDTFYKVAHIPMAIIDLRGKVLVGVGWQDICIKFHRVHPVTCRNCVESDIKLTADIPRGEFCLYKCKNGMWDMATPLFIGDQRIGNLFIGQFFFKGEKVDYSYFKEQAKKYNFPPKEYLEALDKVPGLDKPDIDNAKQFFVRLADSLSQLSYSNIKLARAFGEIKQMAESLRRNEERFFSTLASIGDAVIAVDLRACVTFINPVAEELIGLSSLQILTTPIDEIFSLIKEDTGEPVKNPVIRIFEGGSSTEQDKNVILVKHDGTMIPVDDCGSPIKDKNGLIAGAVLLFRDISDRKRAEKSLEESKSRLERSQKIAHLGSWELDLLKNELSWSDEVYRIFGYTAREFEATYDAFLTAIHPEDRTLVNEVYTNSVRKKKKGYEVEHRIIKKNGEIRIVHEKCEHVRDKSGKIIRSLGMVQDITDRKKSEKELKDSKEKLNIAVQTANIGLWEWDLFSDELILDTRLEKMLGVVPGTFNGSFNDFENLMHEEDLPHFRKSLSEALNENKPLETIFRIRNHNGNKYISVKALPKHDQPGNLTRMTGVCFDITHLKKGTEEILFTLNEELLRSNKALEQFAYVASHDLQEPLRMVSSFTQLLSMKYGDKLDEDAREYIRYAIEGSGRMYDMINGLLAYSRIQTLRNEFREVDMNHILEQVINILSLRIKKSKAIITYDKLPVIFADESQMLQLFQNLISNAIKFSKEIPRVHISLNADPVNYIFVVTDNGIGIDPQYFEKIFKIFQRLVPKEEYPGTGIGLAICKVIVERHGGKIRVESKPDKGSAFYFTLPKKPVTDKPSVLSD